MTWFRGGHGDSGEPKTALGTAHETLTPKGSPFRSGETLAGRPSPSSSPVETGSPDQLLDLTDPSWNYVLTEAQLDKSRRDAGWLI